MKSKVPIKISENGIEFLKKLRLNRIKADIDLDPLYYYELIEVIVKYFKLNNDKYLELVKQKNK